MNQSRRLGAHPRGFTMVELLVAMGIFVILGAALVTILKQGLVLWRTGESRKVVHEKASFLLSYLREDLINAYSRTDGPSPVRFLCDLEPSSAERGARRQRLRLVRTRKGESQHTIASQGGTVIESKAYYDHFRDAQEIREGNLRAGAGLEEVIYFLDPDLDDTTLWRGIRAPPGGASSFLDPTADSQWVIEDRCQPLADGVLYVEYRFWTQYTNTWNDRFYPVPFPHDPGEKSGPAFIWDSTRGLLDPDPSLSDDDFRMVLRPESVGDPSDDIFPRQVRVILVMEIPAEMTLAERIGPQSTRIPLRGASKIPRDAPPYVRIDREWLRFSKIEKGRLILNVDEGTGGRGARWTSPAEHSKGTPVHIGRTFTLTVRIPAYRDDWNPQDE